MVGAWQRWESNGVVRGARRGATIGDKINRGREIGRRDINNKLTAEYIKAGYPP